MTTLQEAAQRALIRRIEAVQRGESCEVTAILKDCHKMLSALASEPQAEPVLINGLTEAETSACASVAGLVGQPGAVGLSERRAYEAWAEANWDLKGADPFSLVGELFPAFQAGRASIASAQPVAPGWMPIETAPDGELVIVGWRDPKDAEQPERHDFDWLEDGCWHCWHGYAEHVEVIGGHGVSYTAPYTHWMRLGAIPAATQGAKT